MAEFVIKMHGNNEGIRDIMRQTTCLPCFIMRNIDEIRTYNNLLIDIYSPE